MRHSTFSQNNKLKEQWRSTLNNEVVKSPCTPITIPEQTIIERILESLQIHASKCPEKPAVIEALNEQRRLTYKQIHDQALSFAAFLISHGFTTGDRVTLALPNSIEWPVAHLGAWAAGGAVVGSSTAFKLYETVYQLEDSGCTVVVTSEHFLDTIIEGSKKCPRVQMIICVRSSDSILPAGIIDFADTLKHAPIDRIAPVTPDSICLIYYSSGTTGQPKGVVHTHRAFHCAVEIMRSHWLNEVYPVLGVDEVDWYKETQIINSACYHLLGFLLLNWNLISGSPMVLVSTFNGRLYLDLIKKFKPRFLIVAPPIFTFLATDVEVKKDALTSVEMIMCSGAPANLELSETLLASHPNVKYIVQVYGMTEVCFACVPLLLERGVNSSCGVVAPSFELKIIDPLTLRHCTQGLRGEVCVRGPPQTIGYLNKPHATKELIDEDGWIHTGDIGYIDERGLLYIVDRMKELVKVSYMNQCLQVSPTEIEGVLLSSDRIKDVAVVGIPEIATRIELVRAFVVKADQSLAEGEVKQLVADKLSDFKHLTGGVVFVEDIPRSSLGKILRRVLRDMNGT